jgi:hypothetical protein
MSKILLQHGETGRMLEWEKDKPVPHGYSEITPVLNIWHIGAAMNQMEQEQMDEYRQYVKACGGTPISKIKP